MSRRTTRTYHGGAANTGSGGTGFTLMTQFFDQLGNLLMQGVSNVITIMTGKTIAAQTDLVMTAVNKASMTAPTESKISSFTKASVFSNTAVNIGSLGTVAIVSVSNMNVNGSVADFFGTTETHIGKLTGGSRLMMLGVRIGATQATAGAVNNEVWATSGHASLPDNVLMIGV